MREGKPPWYEDRVSISKKAERLQELIEEELKRRASGIPRHHWQWAGLEDEPHTKPDLKLVDADYTRYEVLEVIEEQTPTPTKAGWDFYFIMFATVLTGMLASYLIIDWVIGVLQKWIH
jgi:hypothetical protein